MSLFYCPTGSTDQVLETVACELEFGTAETVAQKGIPAYVWRDWDARRFGPAEDPSTGIKVVLSGRLALSRDQWRHAEGLPFRGGLAARIILERYLNGGAEAVTPFNGPALVVVEDPRAMKVTFWTDQFGYHPCYIYRGDDPENRIILTFPDLILCDPATDHSFDLVSMAEFLRGWRTVPPHTYFSAVKHAGAATRTTIDLASGAMTSEEYWRPFEDELFPSIEAAADALAAAVDEAIKERTDFVERPVFMVSGGADSRVLLFSTEDRDKVTGINLYESLADETAVAGALCKAAGANFLELQRDRDFYPRLLPEIVRWSGAMWSAEDSHYLGFADEIGRLQPDLVMTACTTDWVFKGYGLEKSYHQLMGKNLPFYKFERHRRKGFLPNAPTLAPADFERQIRERHDAWFDGCADALATPRDFLKVEDRRIRPACYTVSVSGQIMARTFPYDTFLADSRIAECYSRIDPVWKLNREVWGKAAARLCADAGKIVDANFGWAVDANMPEKAFRFALGWLKRRLPGPEKAAAGMTGEEDRAPSAGSWPDFGWYAKNSPSLEALWAGAPAEHRERMRLVAGEDPWERTLGEWRTDGQRLMRISTLLAHWQEVDARQSRARVNRYSIASEQLM